MSAGGPVLAGHSAWLGFLGRSATGLLAARPHLGMSIGGAAEAARENARGSDGRFGRQQHADPGQVGLDAGGWGDAGVAVGDRSPWGMVQAVSPIAEGVTFAFAAGHEGVKLSPQRNAAIPVPLRRASGWYEGDAEAAIAVAWHPDAFTQTVDRDTAVGVVKDHFPHEFEQATGERVDPSESEVLRRETSLADRERFYAEHAGDFVADSDGADTDLAPGGWTTASALRRTTGERRTFLVPADFYASDHDTSTPRLVPDGAVDITDLAGVARAPGLGADGLDEAVEGRDAAKRALESRRRSARGARTGLAGQRRRILEAQQHYDEECARVEAIMDARIADSQRRRDQARRDIAARLRA